MSYPLPTFDTNPRGDGAPLVASELVGKLELDVTAKTIEAAVLCVEHRLYCSWMELVEPEGNLSTPPGREDVFVKTARAIVLETLASFRKPASK